LTDKIKIEGGLATLFFFVYDGIKKFDSVSNVFKKISQNKKKLLKKGWTHKISQIQERTFFLPFIGKQQ
jgi:hypothetical protein